MKMLDNYDLFVLHDMEQEREREKLPLCDYCGNEIMEEHFYIIGDEFICQECLDDTFKVATIDYTK